VKSKNTDATAGTFFGQIPNEKGAKNVVPVATFLAVAF